MDIVLRKITCDDSLPVSVVENTFQITCEGSDRCAFRRDTSALLSGQCKKVTRLIQCLVPRTISPSLSPSSSFSCSEWIREQC